ncbi:DEAD/DEAH box helicase family protein [Vibrio cholerae]
MLNRAGLKFSYSSENSSIVKDFYIPALKDAQCYYRAVGFFSSASLSIAARGLAPLLRSGGDMRLIIGYPVSAEDFEAIKRGVGLNSQHTEIQKKISEFFLNLEDDLECRRLDALSFLVSSGRLQIRFALRPRGMYHEKIGIISDSDGEKVAFIGSANETENALSDDLNSESINAYFSWYQEIYNLYGIDIEERFEKLWYDNQPVTKTIPASKEFIERLAEFHSGKCASEIIQALEGIETKILEDSQEKIGDLPKLPEYIGRHKYQLRTHQEVALKAWAENNYHGIMKLATGTGKTVTALHASTVLSNHQAFNRGFCLIVSVPYQGLAEQWYEEMKAFNIHGLLCYKSQSLWLQELKNRVSEFNLSLEPAFLALVVVNDTLRDNPSFLAEVNKINSDRIMFVGDECHNHANLKLLNKFPSARLRLGLSATPWSEREADKQELLESFYGEIVTEYGIEEAIEDGVLCPYDYHPVICKMNDEEADQYEHLTSSIAKLEATKESGKLINEDALMHLYLNRTRLLGNLTSKLQALESLVSRQGIISHTLFYCGEGGYENDVGDDEYAIDEVTKILHRRGWRTSKFTSQQSLSLRKKIMNSFKNTEIDALVSKRVLDEGIDVPACTQAFIMASTRNERQYIQRRGRVLRKSLGKDKAVIYDFVAFPPENRTHINCFTSMMQQEKQRVDDFSLLSLNKANLDHLL